MSLIISMISKKGGVVCSDGRKFSSILIKEDGSSYEKATVESDNYNKTFLIQNKILGAYCGLLEFSTKNVSEHIHQIIENKIELPYEDIVTLIETEMKTKLLQISPDEIRFESRKIDLLLVGQIDKKRMQITALRFYPEKNDMITSKEIVITEKENKYFIFGDEKAQKNAILVLKNNKSENTDISFLTRLCKNAIQTGINNSGLNPYSDSKACGGKVHCNKL